MKNSERLSIRFHGHGGDGVVTAARMLAWALIEGEGKNAQMFPTFGPERSGAPVSAFIRICERPLPTPVENPDIVVVFKNALRDDGIWDGVGESTIIIVDSKEPAVKIAKKLNHSVWHLNASEISSAELGKQLPGIALFGALVKSTKIISAENMYLAIRANVPHKFLRGNLRAAHRGFEEVSQTGKFPEVCGCAPKENTALKPGWNEMTTGAVQTEGGNSINYKTGGWGVSLPVIDMEKCKLCMICWAMCPEDSFKVVGGDLVLDEKHCKGCGVCSEVCPGNFNAIKMKAKEEKCDES